MLAWIRLLAYLKSYLIPRFITDQIPRPRKTTDSSLKIEHKDPQKAEEKVEDSGFSRTLSEIPPGELLKSAVSAILSAFAMRLMVVLSEVLLTIGGSKW